MGEQSIFRKVVEPIKKGVSDWVHDNWTVLSREEKCKMVYVFILDNKIRKLSKK